MKNVYLLTHLNAEGHIFRPFFIVCQIILAFFRPLVLDSKVHIQQRYVQMTCGELITSTIRIIAMNMTRLARTSGDRKSVYHCITEKKRRWFLP